MKGFHLHFDQIDKNLEMGIVALDQGKIGLVQVGKNVGTAIEVSNAVSVFERALQVASFRSELLVRLRATQEYLISTNKGFQTY